MESSKILRELAVRVTAQIQAMDIVLQGSTPDHAKWIGANSFARRYNDAATAYNQLVKKNATTTYDITKLQNPFDQLWPQQKQIFDMVYADSLVLNGLLKIDEDKPIGPFYNLLVAGYEDAWNGSTVQFEFSRCLREYTKENLTNKFGELDSATIAMLKRSPCIFAYEKGLKIDPKFGFLTEIVSRQGQVRVSYEIHSVDPFLTHRSLEELRFELDIDKMELYRSHWAIKEVNLPKELHSNGIVLPSALRDVGKSVDVSSFEFSVALSFPGEVRTLVEGVAEQLERILGPNSYFYDFNYTSQLAQPSLDLLLQGIYRRSKLIVAFLSADYQRKEWCGVEFKVVREIIKQRDNARVMYVRTDDGSVDGVFDTDGYVDASQFDSSQIAELIAERLKIVINKIQA